MLVLTAAIALSACGSGDDPAAAGISARSAKATVERAADVKLVAQPVPDAARAQGLRASFSNAPTAAQDDQAVFLFLLEDAAVADKVKEAVRGSVPGPSQLIVRGEILVVYATNGSDHAAQVKKALNAL